MNSSTASATVYFEGTTLLQRLLKEQWSNRHFENLLETQEKNRSHQPPVLRITEKNEAVHIVYNNQHRTLLKPLSLEHLIKAVKELEVPPLRLRLGNGILDTVGRFLECGSTKTFLREKECDLLAFLLSCPENSASKKEILDAVWGSGALTTRTVETHIYQIRQKIEQTPDAPCLILSTPRGYKIAKS
jgi:DNA-binding response OmpR family regulator